MPRLEISLPDLDRFPNVNQSEVFDYLQKLSLFDTVISWFLDSSFRRGTHLQTWCNDQLNNDALKKIVVAQKWDKIEKSDDKVKLILNYWQNGGKGGLKYVGDKANYGKDEYWATITEILKRLKDDCDGFANIIYHSCILAGVSPNRIYIVAGDVVGGGHCYVVYVGNNGLEYPIDGCYWQSESLKMKVPYFERSDYYHGEEEWFRFNHTGMFKVLK